MKFLLVVSLLIFQLFANDIDSLLQSYHQESELSKKTKDESAGNLIVYTRDDLERMQVESLKDILKSLRFFPYQENRLGKTDIYNGDPLSFNSRSIRLYLNDTELLTTLSGSGLLSFGDMEIDFINHVEIYVGFPSFDFGIEPATIVIRLYTKSPKHDSGGRAKFVVGSHGTNKQNIYYADAEEDFSYFVYANRTDNKRESYEKDGEVLKRDGVTKRFYGSLESENHKLSVHVMQSDSDAFLGSLISNIVPTRSKIDSQYMNVALNSSFMNDTLTLDVSYIDAKKTFSYRYASSFLLLPSFVPITSLDQVLEEEALTARVKKVFKVDNHTISVGMQYRYKYFDLTDATFNIPIPRPTQAYKKEEVYSMFIQDSIAIYDNHLLSFSAMKQYSVRDGDVDTQHLEHLRMGYTYTNEAWVAKTFLSQQDFGSEPYMTISPNYGNKDLEKETYTSIIQELSYRSFSTLSKIVLGYGVNENIPILSESLTPKIVNSDQKTAGILAALEFTYFFSQKDKLEIQTNYAHLESALDNTKSYTYYNHTMRMLNTVQKFDIFNELVINHGDTRMGVGYDYSFGVKYAFSKDLRMNIKGENIFNSGMQRSYLTRVIPTPDSVVVPIIERRFLFGLEYLF